MQNALLDDPGTYQKFQRFEKELVVEHDSLKENLIPALLTKVDCVVALQPGSDFESREGFYLKEYVISIGDTLRIDVMERQDTLCRYIYSYRGTPFRMRNFYGEMYERDAELCFHFDTRECYLISGNSYLMREQPSRWSGLANQYDFYQIIDLQKMEILQFAALDSSISQSVSGR